MQKTIIIFANSVKRHQHCVAGKDIDTKKWVRPVSKSEEKELTTEQCTCDKSQEPVKLLQKINIDLLKHDPLENQPENYLISDKKWSLSGFITRNEVNGYLDKPDSLWLDGESQNDRVAYNLIETKKLQIAQSLYLIAVEKIHIHWKDRSKWNQNPQRRGKFKYNDVEYDLAITDSNLKKYEEQDLSNKYLCISLGGQFNGFCYKIIASIF
ncbi:MAG: hypothetical protein EF806_03680 [Candidatus Methanoliparum thermophilum]|uniref:Dual OB-containing domain-containing protein n=1 Tax=Methanoliparum thermophilum TaxID=2491083 RepID=A0A520KRR6_METT2|nr:MAG: hypothetical protein EF806_03680 [Candidatus Methanoliparum thermophilum]